MKTNKKTIPTIDSIRVDLTAARAADKAHDLPLRTKIATRIFRRSRVHVLGNGNTVETWWDRQSLNWITHPLDAEGNQLADADFSGEKNDAAIAHLWALIDASSWCRCGAYLPSVADDETPAQFCSEKCKGAALVEFKQQRRPLTQQEIEAGGEFPIAD
tara:strand:+ start:2529 stop:3005 length:477 start_codon:yes stop_codon:yes gene_type:complete